MNTRCSCFDLRVRSARSDLSVCVTCRSTFEDALKDCLRRTRALLGAGASSSISIDVVTFCHELSAAVTGPPFM